MTTRPTMRMHRLVARLLLVALLAISGLAGIHNHPLLVASQPTLAAAGGEGGGPGQVCAACQWSSSSAGRPAPAGVTPALVALQPVAPGCAPAAVAQHPLPTSPRAPPTFSLL